MAIFGSILVYASAVVTLVCLIIVWIRMFQNGQTGLGIACIVLAFCCGLGTLITFIYGWTKSKAWNLQTIMLIWTIAWVVGLIGAIMSPSTVPTRFPQNISIEGRP